MTNRALGLIIAAGVFIADRLSKYWIIEIFGLPSRGTYEILPFFNFTMVWNRGISFGLFPADGDTGRYLLAALTAAIAIGLIVWLFKGTNRLVAIALGFIIAGAFGNLWDRFEYQAVADFLHFYAFGYSFYVFNVADMRISVGVALLILDAFLDWRRERKVKAGEAAADH